MREKLQAIKSTKHQHPSSREYSNINIQYTQLSAVIFGACELGASLELGGWTLGASPRFGIKPLDHSSDSSVP
jgi:hypothetical protein